MRSLKSIYAVVSLTILLLTALPLTAQADSPPCVLGYTVGFFNGVWNTELEAMDGRNAVQDAFREASGRQDDTYNHEDVNYELFYNHSGGTVGATGLQDIAEVFVQRANELDPSGNLSSNGFFFFWESYSGDTPGYSGQASTGSAAIATFLENFVNSVVQGALTTLSNELSSPPTQTDYFNQQSQLDQLAQAGRKLVLVAHSQGNLFLNLAYDHEQPMVGSTRIKAVHIAPASPTLRGQYVLANIDLVINGLRALNGTNTVPDINLTLVPSGNDKSGHTLVGTYLDGTRPGRGAVQTLLTNAFSALQASSCPLTVTPPSSSVSPGASIVLTAALNPMPQDPNVQVSYAWSTTGTAGGQFVQASGNSPTAATLVPTITYMANANATAGEIDTITVTAYAGPVLGDPTQDETLGTITAIETIEGGGLQNGDFSQGLAHWANFGTVRNITIGNAVTDSRGNSCLASELNNPYAWEDAYGTDSGIEQTFLLPAGATSISLTTWNNLDPVTVTVTLIDSSGTPHVLASLVPPSMQMQPNPYDFYDYSCTGNSPANLTLNVGAYAGTTVTLQLESSYLSGVNGTIANFDNVVVK